MVVCDKDPHFDHSAITDHDHSSLILILILILIARIIAHPAA